MRSRTPLAVLCTTLFLASSVRAQFVPGHIFVVEGQLEGCFESHAHHGTIWEIDPETGEASVFLDPPEELCGGVPTLIFTPNGKRLRASRGFIANEILEFDAAGNYEVVLDGDDGLRAPLPMTYDADGNFYVGNNGANNIMRFPADGASGIVFADASDGISGPISMTFASTGDLYVAVGVAPGPIPTRLLRITAEGATSVFDEYDLPDQPQALTADRFGNLFIAVGNWFYRYRAGDPDSKELLSPESFGRMHQITMSPDESQLYVPIGLWVRTVDVTNGFVEALALVPGVNSLIGIAVAPLRVGDLTRNGSIDLADFAVHQRCFRGDEVPGGGPGCEAADLDQDGSVNLADYSVLFGAFEGP